MDEIIKIKNLSVSFDGNPALRNVSVSVKRNRITAVTGHSGSGKSTLLSAVNGLLALEENAEISGDIFLDGVNTRSIPEGELRRRIGTVQQVPAPFPFSIRRNMSYAPVFYGIRDRKRLSEIMEEKLKVVGLYDEVRDRLDKNASKLSGGQQQRLCIARALTAEPEVILLDEPCSSLDYKNTRLIEELLTELKEQYTIVLVTHNLQEAKRVADDGIFISGGEIVESGSFRQMLESPQREETAEYLRDIKD